MKQTWLWRATAVLSLVALVLAGLLIGQALKHRHSTRPTLLSVVFLNVGDGDSTLILTPDGHAILIDAGDRAAGPLIVQTLKHLHVNALDLLVMASPDAGCIGGVPAIVNQIPVRAVWDNAVDSNTTARQEALEAIRTHHIPSTIAHAGNKNWVGHSQAMLTALWPPETGPRSRRDALVCRLDYGQTSYLFEGAANGSEEEFLVGEAGDQLACDTLQVAAHGDASATSAELLRQAAPSIAVISCGGNTQPSVAALHRLTTASAGIWRTDMQGSVTVATDGHSLPITTAAHL